MAGTIKQMDLNFYRPAKKGRTAKFLVGFFILSFSINMLGLPVLFYGLNVPSAFAVTDTGFTAPTTASTAGSYNDWDTNTVANIQSSDDSYVSDNDEGQNQGYEDFGFSIPAGSVVNGIEASVEAKSSDASGCQIQVALSWNNGANFSSNKTSALTDSDATYILGGASDNWGHASWTNTQLNNSNFVARISLDDVGPGNTCTSGTTASVDQLQVKVYYTPPVLPEPNPALTNACGLDIALVLDSSGSIGSSNMTLMKNDFKSFVDTFLPATPTMFSVVDFDSVATIRDVNSSMGGVQNFSDIAADIKSAIDLSVSGGSTNWEDGLIKAQSTFDPRSGSTHPNLVIFASDGDPNVPSTNALDAAVTVANSIKSDGTRIITLGIGSSVNQANLEAISSADAYYSAANFSDLSTALQGIVDDLCGGTITVKKLVDGVPASDWSFDVNGSPTDPSPVLTGVDGFTSSIPVDQGTYSVNEGSQSGYSFVSAECKVGDNVVGTSGTGSVTGIAIGSSDIVSCTFNNHQNQIPVITVTGDNPLPLVVNVGTYTEQGATANDAEDGLSTWPTGIWTIDSSAININAVGNYSVFYDFTDSNGAPAVQKTRTVNVVPGTNECNDTVDNDGDSLIDFGSDPGCTSIDDTSENQPPVITVDVELVTLTLGSGAPVVTTGVTANDPEDSDITSEIVVGGETVDTNTIDDYTVTYDVEDSDGAAAAQKTRTYKVRAQCDDGIDNDGDQDVDYDSGDAGDSGCEGPSDNSENSPPVIELIGLSLVSVPAGSTYTDAGATAHDNEDPDAPVTGVGTVNTSVPGNYTLTYDHTDTGGLSAPQVTRTVTVTPYPQCSDGQDNDEDSFIDYGSEGGDPGCDGPQDNDETDPSDVTPPASSFTDNKNHVIIDTELLSLNLTGTTTDDFPIVKSGINTGVIEIYKVAGEDVLADQTFNSIFNETLSCDRNSQVPVELVALNLVSTNPITLSGNVGDLNRNWSYDWTPQARGVYCFVVHANDVAGNVEHTAIAGPLAYTGPISTPTPTPPTPTPTPPTGGGCFGNCGGYTPPTPTPSPSSAPSPSSTPAPQVLGATTQTLPATSAPMSTNILLSLFVAMIATGGMMMLIGYGLTPSVLKRYLD